MCPRSISACLLSTLYDDLYLLLSELVAVTGRKSVYAILKLAASPPYRIVDHTSHSWRSLQDASLRRSKAAYREAEVGGRGWARRQEWTQVASLGGVFFEAPAFDLHRVAGYPKVTSSSDLLCCYSAFLVPMQDNESHIHIQAMGRLGSHGKPGKPRPPAVYAVRAEYYVTCIEEEVHQFV